MTSMRLCRMQVGTLMFAGMPLVSSRSGHAALCAIFNYATNILGKAHAICMGPSTHAAVQLAGLQKMQLRVRKEVGW